MINYCQTARDLTRHFGIENTLSQTFSHQVFFVTRHFHTKNLAMAAQFLTRHFDTKNIDIHTFWHQKMKIPDTLASKHGTRHFGIENTLTRHFGTNNLNTRQYGIKS